MQKSKTAVRLMVSRRGSVLVGVVAFTAIVAIASLGYMSMSGTATNHEMTALEDARAFHAAESGLLIATRWLRDSTNWVNSQASTLISDVFAGTINGNAVDVDIVKQGNSFVIQSNAVSPELGYTKRISWSVAAIQATNPGVFINNLWPSGAVGGGGLNNTWFDGPFHSNTPVYISSASGGNVSVKFMNGRVTTHNMTVKANFFDSPEGHWGNYGQSPTTGNDYEYGLWTHKVPQNHQNQTDKIDPHFQHEYTGEYVEFKHSQDSLYMPRVEGGYSLPQNQSSAKKAILRFYVSGNEGRAAYYYYDAAGNQQTAVDFSIENITSNPVVNSNILRISNDVQVLGDVKGQATVVTEPGSSIYPVGDLMYHGFTPDETAMSTYDNSANYGLGSMSETNNSIIALVSGNEIEFGLVKNAFSLQGVNAVLTPVNTQESKREKYPMYLTAQLIAIEGDHGIKWATSNANNYSYVLRALGSRTIDVYRESYNAQGNPGHDTFRFYYDTRLSEGLKGPGVPAIQTGDSQNSLFRLKGDWREENLI
jgi:Tfp pilus assembly protein PilX